jgi:hypothetical protein
MAEGARPRLAAGDPSSWQESWRGSRTDHCLGQEMASRGLRYQGAVDQSLETYSFRQAPDGAYADWGAAEQAQPKAIQMTNFITEESVDKALHWLMTNATAAAKARAEKVYLEEYTKALRSKLMQEHKELPVSAQEREACADPRYAQHLEVLKIAVENDAKITFIRGACEARIEAWRTQAATERAMKV